MEMTRTGVTADATSFRERYLADHPGASAQEAALRFVMTRYSALPRLRDDAERRARIRQAIEEYAAFIVSARRFAEASIEPPKPAVERVVAEVRSNLAIVLDTVAHGT
jgi:hypothetical protein